MDHFWLFFTLICSSVHHTSAVPHSLQYCFTELSAGTHYPEFTVVGLVDDQVFVYYDSEILKMIPRSEWIKKIVDYDQQQLDNQKELRFLMTYLMKKYHHTTGVHTVQQLQRCELYDNGKRTTHRLLSYDGETLDQIWTNQTDQTVNQTDDFDCIKWLKKFLEHSRSVLERKVPPKTDLFQRNSSSPVVCLAAGFFPKPVNMTWQKNGEDVDEDVETGETLPSPNSTYQKRSVLSVSPEELKNNKYTCVIQHSSLEAELNLSHIRILTDGGLGGGSGGGLVPIIIGAVMAVLLLVLIGSLVGYFIWKKKKKSGNRVSDAQDAQDGGAPTLINTSSQSLDSGSPLVNSLALSVSSRSCYFSVSRPDI